MYDIIIVGAGPSGLALAQCISNIGLKILIIDADSGVGGSHRVTRVKVNTSGRTENLFTEHAPRIYSTSYKNFIMLLNEMGYKFDYLFVPYNFQITTVGNKTILSTLSLYEMSVIFYDFMVFLFDNNYGMNMTVGDRMRQAGFSTKSFEIVDKVCRFTDGAGADKYTLNEFLQLPNQQAFYTVYQPNKPNDVGLFKIWREFLEKKNVTFMMNTYVESLEFGTDNSIKYAVLSDGKKIEGKKFVLATPPMQIVRMISHSKDNRLKNLFGNFDEFKKWSEETNYIMYLQATFHWDTDLNLPPVYGFPSTEWNIAFIVLSDYMKFEEPSSKTVISIAITRVDRKSDFTGKTVNESTQEELMKEMLRVLRLSYPNLPDPTIMILDPHVKRENNGWTSSDTSYISAPHTQGIPFASPTVSNLFTVGTHNGKSIYKLTSMESAVTNAIIMSHELYPDLKQKYPIQKIITVNHIFHVILIILITIILIFILFYFL